MDDQLTYILLLAYTLDLLVGDPRWLPHLIVGYGKLIALGEKTLNKGRSKVFKGGLLTLILVAVAYLSAWWLIKELQKIGDSVHMVVSAVLFFYCLSNRSLINEGLAVFKSLTKEGLTAARKRLSWIVGRDTDHLDEQQVKKAVFETLSENLSDGVIAPLFYFFLLGIPGAMAYKMINTLDSMIGYKTERYLCFGQVAARLDDLANIVPSRLTAFLMLVVAGKLRGLLFVLKEGKKHSSPNAGYPEAALAYIMSCKLGGPNYYYGKLVMKPFIGQDKRSIEDKEIRKVVMLNLAVSLLAVIIMVVLFAFGKWETILDQFALHV